MGNKNWSLEGGKGQRNPKLRRHIAGHMVEEHQLATEAAPKPMFLVRMQLGKMVEVVPPSSA